MTNDTITAARALKNASQALKRGNKPAARRWAQRAITLDRGAAEPWLILAQVSGPRARAVYLKQAESLKPGMPTWLLTIVSVVFFTAALALAAAVWYASSGGILVGKAMISSLPGIRSGPGGGQPEEGSTAYPAGISLALSPTASSTATYTPFPAYTFTPTATPTPLPTSTFTPSPTPLPTSTLTPVPTATEPLPAPPPEYQPAQGSGKSILVSISEQHVYAYEGDILVLSFAASTGRGNTTLPGNFQILDKIPNAYSYPWGFWMPDWMGIYWVGSNLENGFHSLPVLYNGQTIWGDAIGTPVTYGCVVLQPGDMQQLFDWAVIGTPVRIVP